VGLIERFKVWRDAKKEDRAAIAGALQVERRAGDERPESLILKAAASGWRSLKPSEQETLRRWMSADTDYGEAVSMLRSLIENEDARAWYVDHDTGWWITGRE
jgi:hypothetical protein